jgi:hypothetical protein
MFDLLYPMFGVTRLVQEHFFIHGFIFKRLIHVECDKRFGPILGRSYNRAVLLYGAPSFGYEDANIIVSFFT